MAIDEYLFPALSDPETAETHSFRHQKKDRLVSSHLIEHLLLPK